MFEEGGTAESLWKFGEKPGKSLLAFVCGEQGAENREDCIAGREGSERLAVQFNVRAGQETAVSFPAANCPFAPAG